MLIDTNWIRNCCNQTAFIFAWKMFSRFLSIWWISRACVLCVCLISEALASSLVTEINLAMARLVDIWDSIGIMEEQRVERMQTVKKHIDVSCVCIDYTLASPSPGFKIKSAMNCSLPGSVAFHDHGGRGFKASHQNWYPYISETTRHIVHGAGFGAVQSKLCKPLSHTTYIRV